MKKKIIAAVVAAITIIGLAGCSGYSEEYQERKDKQSTALENSLGIQNQKDRLEREEDPNQVRYVYILAPLSGDVLGYYTIQGKVSSSGTQNAPEQEIVDVCASSYCPEVVDSAKDDGTYGPSETGSFFFTTEGVLIEIDGLAYIQSDSPIRLYNDAALLNEK